MPDPQIYVQDYIKSERTVRPSSSTIRRHVPKLGNPTPLGLSAFALSTFVLSFYNLHLFGIQTPEVVVGVSLFTGGVVQFAAGMWEFKVGNTFGGTGFSAFGGFWASFAVLYLDSFGIKQAYLATGPGGDDMYNNALGVYCLAWFVFTFIFTLACMRTNLGVLMAFVFLTISFLSLSIFHFTRSDVFEKIGGITGMATSFTVWYCTAATLLTPDLSPISLPLYNLSAKDH